MPFQRFTGTKYGAKKAEYDGMKFDSTKEMKRYIYLKSLQDEGLIHDLRCQVVYELFPNQYETYTTTTKRGLIKEKQRLLFRHITYTADFVYIKANGEEVIEDVKGYVLPVYKLKEKLVYIVFKKKIRRVMKATEAV